LMQKFQLLSGRMTVRYVFRKCMIMFAFCMRNSKQNAVMNAYSKNLSYFLFTPLWKETAADRRTPLKRVRNMRSSPIPYPFHIVYHIAMFSVSTTHSFFRSQVPPWQYFSSMHPPANNDSQLSVTLRFIKG